MGEGINVLYVIGQLSRGGQERQLSYLLSSTNRDCVNPMVFVWNLDEGEANYDIINRQNIKICGSNCHVSRYRKFKKLRDVIKKNKINIVQSYTFYLNFICWLASLGLKSKPIGALRHVLNASMAVHGQIGGTLNTLFPKRIIINNFTGAHQVIEKFGWLKGDGIYIITNKIPLTSFEVYVKNSDHSNFVTASIGSLMPLKRIDILVEVIYSLKQRGYHILHLHTGEGKERANVTKLIDDYKLQDTFFLLGEVSDVNTHIASCDIFLHAADAEGTPNVIMEALACGRPVVSTDCGDARFLVENGETGFIVPPGSVAMLIEKIEFLLCNYEKRKQMGINARAFAENNFDVSKLFEENYKIYCQMLRKGV